jgi:hypothetical protein
MTRAEARDQVHSVLKAAWDSDLTSSEIALYYQDVNLNLPTDSDGLGVLPWALAEVVHTNAKFVSIGRNARRRVKANLNVFIFTPLGDGLVLNDSLCQIVENAFLGSAANEIYYRDVVSLEQGRNGAWETARVIISFEYYGN